jgi:DNA (cytosine-5)-methyltransferase 1
VDAVVTDPPYGINYGELMKGKGRAGEFADSHANAGVMPAIVQGWAVRRLTPVECARLQGFPDHHSRIPWRGKPAEECPDGPQYKTYGNSMAVNVMRWIGERIEREMMT